MQKTVEEFLKNNPEKINDGYISIANECGVHFLEVEEHFKNKQKVETVFTQPNDLRSLALEAKRKLTFRAEIPKDLGLESLKKALLGNNNIIKNTVKEKSNVLIIGDIHEPFCLDSYIDFCKEQYIEFNCDKVVFIGDVIDNHFSSFHNTDPDGFGAGEELERAIFKISKWVKEFPNATVIIGNHDRLAYRKAFAGGVSKKWIREYNDVLNAPGWEFTERIEIDDVVYVHGEAGTARTKAKDTGKSRVQGHLHSQAYCEFINNRVFAMQVGSGINDKAYAFGYAKDGKESIISCGIVLEGKQPFLIKM